MAEAQDSRRLKVGRFGNSFWAKRLAESLPDPPLDIQCLYRDQDTTLRERSVRQWLAESALWSCDVLHVLGWPRLWNLWIAARLKRVPTILHWLGSDVSSFRASPRWCRVAGPALNQLVTRHLAQAPWLAKELRAMGIHAQVATRPIQFSRGHRDIPAADVTPVRSECRDYWGILTCGPMPQI
jgi:hypothetical protein